MMVSTIMGGNKGVRGSSRDTKVNPIQETETERG